MSFDGVSEPKERVLIVVNVLWFFISHRLPIARAAIEAGYEVHVAAGGALPLEILEIERIGLIFHPINVRRSSFSPIHNIGLLFRLLRLYRSVRPDLVHHVTVKPVLLGTLVARILRVPAVVNAVSGLGFSFSIGSVGRRLLRRSMQIAFRLCLVHPNMVVIFQNEDDRSELIGRTGIEAQRTVVIAGSGVDLARYSPEAEPPGVPMVLLVARMLRDKGIAEFAEAGRLLRSRSISARFVMAGRVDLDNPAAISEQELLALCAATGTDWLGQRDDVPDLLHASAIVCLPSYREGFPKALAEAAACGRPVVTCDVPGCRDAVVNRETGLLVPARNSLVLAEALDELLRDAGKRERFGAAGRRRAEQHFDVQGIARCHVNIYSELLR